MHEKIHQAINELRSGKMVILTDHHSRENEGDIIFPAEIITPEIINFMIQHCSGIICLALTEEHLKRLQIPLMVPIHSNSSQRHTAFTVSIEAKKGVTTGVSAQDRAMTILATVATNAVPDDIAMPGHIFPLQANINGVLERAGHTEGSIDLMKIAGFKSAAVLCEMMNKDGTMTKGKDLIHFAKQHQITMLSIDDIIDYRLYHENLIEEETTAEIPLEKYGNFQITIIREKINKAEHVILHKNNMNAKEPLLVRIHSSCMTGDLFGSNRCDCHQQLQYSLKKISEEGGMLIYLNQEGRGIGLFNKIKTYVLQETGLDTVEANEYLGLSVDSRQYYIAAHYLKAKKINHVRLMTNNPAKVNDLKKYGIACVDPLSTPLFINSHNKKYLKTKKDKLHHQISSEDLV